MQEFVRVARLQNEVCTKDFFRATKFVTKNAPKFSPKIFSLHSVGQKKSRKIPAKFPTKFPCEKSKKVRRRASAGVQGEEFVVFWEIEWGVFGRGGFSNNRFVLKPDVAIASEVSILSTRRNRGTFNYLKTPFLEPPHSQFQICSILKV